MCRELARAEFAVWGGDTANNNPKENQRRPPKASSLLKPSWHSLRGRFWPTCTYILATVLPQPFSSISRNRRQSRKRPIAIFSRKITPSLGISKEWQQIDYIWRGFEDWSSSKQEKVGSSGWTECRGPRVMEGVLGTLEMSYGSEQPRPWHADGRVTQTDTFPLNHVRVVIKFRGLTGLEDSGMCIKIKSEG